MIELNDEAQVQSVLISKPSGNEAFDKSALAAVRRAGDFRELLGLDSATYQKYFRKFGLDFNPSAAKT